METCTGRIIRWLVVTSRKFLTKMLIVIATLLAGYTLMAWIGQTNSDEETKRHTFKGDNNNELSDDVTIITAYFNIGEFPKADLLPIHRRTPDNYSNWMMSFRYIQNPVIAIFDAEDTKFTKRFKKVRKGMDSITDIRTITRDELWTFRMISNVSRIFNQSGYPIHYPNTVMPEYACLSSAKFELTKLLIEENPYKTKYFAWADIGYFRRRLSEPIHLYLPQGFDQDKIAFTKIREYVSHVSPVEIITDNINWVGGGYFTGHHSVMNQFMTGYLKNLHYFISRNIMAAEQQLIYAMYNRKFTRALMPEIQTYGVEDIKDTGCSEWFVLGCICWKQPVDY